MAQVQDLSTIYQTGSFLKQMKISSQILFSLYATFPPRHSVSDLGILQSQLFQESASKTSAESAGSLLDQVS